MVLKLAMHNSAAIQHQSVQEVWLALEAIFTNLRQDLKILQAISTCEEMLASIDSILAAQGNPWSFKLQIGCIARAVKAYISAFETVIDASIIEQYPNWQAAIWGCITIYIKLSHEYNFCIQQALDQIELLTTAANLSSFGVRNSTNHKSLNNAREELHFILAELACSLGGICVYLRSRPKLQSRRGSSQRLEQPELERVRLSSRHIDLHVRTIRAGISTLSLAGTRRHVKLPFNNITKDMLSNRYFGRIGYLSFIKAALDRGGRTRNFHLALHGLPGVGKTQLAVRFAQHYCCDYDIVIWTVAVSKERIQESLARAAYGLQLPGCELEVQVEERVQNLLSYLESTEDRWLIVYDNVDDISVLAEFKMASASGHIIITSRDPDSGAYPVKEGIAVTPFTLHDSYTFFLSNAGLSATFPVPPKLECILREWDGLPMALDQMSSLIRERRLSLTAFLAMYEKRRAKVHSMHGTYAREWGYENTTATAFSIESLDSDARKLLHIMAFMDPDQIYDESDLLGSDLNSAVLLNAFEDEFVYLTAKEELMKRSLLQIGEPSLVHTGEKTSRINTLRVHRLVQAVAFDDMRAERRRETFRKILSSLSTAYPTNVTGSSLLHNWDQCERYSAHMSYLLKHRGLFSHGPGRDEDQVLRRLVSTCTWYMFEIGNFSEADRLLHDAEPLLGDDIQSAAVRFSLAGIRNECNRIVEAKVQVDKVVEIQENLLPAGDLTLGHTYYSAGLVYMELGDLETAYSFYMRALKVYGLGVDRGEVDKHLEGAIHANLGYYYRRIREIDQASEHAEKEYALHLEEFGQKSDHFAESCFDLGNVRLAQRDYTSAMRLHERALGIRQEITPAHDKTGYSLHKMAALRASEGHFGTALALIDQAIAIFERNLDHVPRVARSTFKKAEILDGLERLDDAREARYTASQLRRSIKTFEFPNEESEEAYDHLVCSFFR
ncbi:hypothetical protein AC579_10509 [Pseudocercospora musae]|uniref:Uncharacterized protein n=1 Tax=Pseudocercospora musae TaxID=113226 RepID=A0A139I512_9PEZI|nr:hypothetical protein AC579_10509 [Pseudocercospora musae]